MSDTTTITPEERAAIRSPSERWDALWYPHDRCHKMMLRLLTALEAAEARAEQAEAENARLRKRLEAALDKIADIQDEWESEGVCHACGICAGIPYEWQPTDDHCCRVMLDLWSNGEPLPWEEAARRAVGEG